MKLAILFYSPTVERWIASFSDGTYKEFHCGDCFEIKIGNKFIPTRFEYSHSKGCWYLVDIDSKYLVNRAKIRINN